MCATPSPASRLPARVVAAAAAVIVFSALLAYCESFRVPFLFDDGPAITGNASLRRLAQLGDVLAPELRGGETTSGRPILNLSLALNYAATGDRPWSYHAVNLAIHVLAGLTLFGVVLRTLLQPALRGKFGSAALVLAAGTAALWTLHPLQTESVTYVVQRAEALMGLFYLLTLYGFIRAAESPVPVWWLGLSWFACLLGMATKEVMVSAPLVVLLYDRTFIARSLRDAWARRWPYYTSLAATWVVLAILITGTQNRGGTAGFDTNLTPWHYFLTQCQAIVHYLRLVEWPQPLVFDYGTRVVGRLADVFWQVALLGGLGAGVLWALKQSPGCGFLGFCFFAILAPSSSVVPVASRTIAEHRMYLPLAVPIIALVLLLFHFLGRRSFAVGVVLAAAWGMLTYQRNTDYHSELALWADTVAKRPDNPRAHHNLGLAELRAGRIEAARADFETALRLRPDSTESHFNLGVCLMQLGRPAEAIPRYERALGLRPDYAEAHNNLGNAFLALGRAVEARSHYQDAIKLKPAFAEAHSNLSDALLRLDSVDLALYQATEAIRLKPDFAEAYFNAGNACAELRRFAEARSFLANAVRFNPDHARAHNNLANVLLELDRPEEAIDHYQQAIARKPDFINPRRNLALLLLHLDRPSAAEPHLQVLARALPNDPEIARALAQVRASLRR